METIGPYRVTGSMKGGRRPMYVAAGKDGSSLVLKTVPLADLSAEERERFEREASVCATLDHPNLIRVVDSGATAEVLYQAMPLLEGADFSKVLASGRKFTWDEKLSIMEDVCGALAYAHARKLVHRDVKPANLFLETNGRVRVLDFGMVRLDSSALTRAGAAIGTLNYMAPEQIRGEPCTAATDVFSTAIVFQELSTGVHPFAGQKKSLPEILSAILFDAPPSWNSMDAPEGLEFVVRRALEKDPAKRWPSAAEFRQAIALCRFTLENRQEKKIEVVAAAVASSPAASADADKTMVIRRDTSQRQAMAAPVSRAEPPPPKRELPLPAVKPDKRFCPGCARPNALDAAICAYCGVPLSSQTAVDPPAQRFPSTAILIGAAVTVVIAMMIIAVFVSRP